MAESSTRINTRAYGALLRSRLRSQRSHRASFWTDMVASALVTVTEFFEVWVLFHNVEVIGGMKLAGVMVAFGLAEMTFAMADAFVGHCDDLPRYLRAGTLDVFYLRPLPVLAQLVTSDLQLRRLARIFFGGVCLVAGLVLADIDWSLDKVALLAVVIPCGAIVYASLFISAGGLQFFLIDGAETTNAYVYGGRYAGSQPASVWPRSLLVVFGVIFPVIFTSFLPALWLTDNPGTDLLQGWAAWLAPLAALWAALFAALAWRFGMRHYQGGGG